MSRFWYILDDEIGRFPRVSGDEPWATLKTLQQAAFSPRERG